jgi:hypothetical protein
MLPDRALLADRLPLSQSLVDIGGYLRSAGRSLGIVIDIPRLDTQISVSQQGDNIVEALEAALRLQRWWKDNAQLLREWISLLPEALSRGLYNS